MAHPTVPVASRYRPVRRAPALLLLLGAVVVGIVLSLEYHQQAELVDTLRLGIEQMKEGQLVNLSLDAEGLRLGDDPSFLTTVGSRPERFGLYTSPVTVTSDLVDAVAGKVFTTGSDGSALLEARISTDGVAWSEWRELPSGEWVVPVGREGRFVQWRLTLFAPPAAEGISVQQVHLDLLRTSAGPVVHAAGTNPTVRLFGSREGLVGRRTANGHLIVPNDRFAALPSRRALSTLGGREYEVTVSYHGKSVTVPVWDVGPWNTKDNFWDVERELWKDLARFVPQAQEAYFRNHNGGRDQRGRWVTLPNAIDLADGTFADLGMRVSDWVDVTFRWVDAPSPTPMPLGRVVYKYPPPGEVPLTPVAAPVLVPSPTPVPQGLRWYFAEGNTRPPFDTWYLLQNPSMSPARVRLVFMKTDGTSLSNQIDVPARSRVSVHARQIVPESEFSVRMESDRPVFAERAMYFRRDGIAAAGVSEPSRTWYLAEGSTSDPFDTWFLVQNPGAAPATVTFTFMLEGGGTRQHRTLIPPSSRQSLYANLVLQDQSFATRVEADQPVIVERAMFLRNGPGGGHGSPGATSPSTTWYFAEGDTTQGFDTWLLVQNPGNGPANLSVWYLPESGSARTMAHSLPPQSRLSIHVNQHLPGERFGMVVRADSPIVAERRELFGESNGEFSGSHGSLGASEPARTWYLPEGSTSSPFTERLLVANPNQGPATLMVEFMKPAGEVVPRSFVVPASSRLTIDVGVHVPDSSLSTVVTSDVPVVVERTMYFHDGQGGTNALGVPRR